MTKWLCPHDGTDLRVRALITEVRRQCTNCGLEWDVKGFPLNPKRNHLERAVKI